MPLGPLGALHFRAREWHPIFLVHELECGVILDSTFRVLPIQLSQVSPNAPTLMAMTPQLGLSPKSSRAVGPMAFHGVTPERSF